MIYDFNTDNISFIKIANEYKKLGIKKYMFPLKLYDDKLQGVRLYDKDGNCLEDELSLEIKIRIQREIRINIWYFLREVVRIPEAGGTIRYQAHRGNMALTYCIENNIDTINLLPRQNGKTIGAVCGFNWIYHYTTINTNMIFSNKQYDDSKLNIKRFNDITELLPNFLKQHLNVKNDTDNLAMIACASTNNTIQAMSTARDESSADKLGRGMTTPIAWFDEFAFLKHNKKIFDSAAFALSKASEAAKRNGTPSMRLITTTPNNLDSPEGLYCYSLIKDAIKFDENWYDWNIEDVKKIISKSSLNDFVHIQFNYIELGHDEEWLNKQKKLVNNDLLTIKREIFIQWTLAGDTSPFSEEQLSAIERYVKQPIGYFYINNIYKFEIYEELYNVTNRNYVIAIDVAAGLESDSSVITILDPFDYHTVAKMRNNRIDTPDLVDVVIKLVLNYFNSSVIVPERNNMGISVIQMLLKSPVANRIYYEVKKQKAEKDVQIKGRAKKVTKEKRVYGIDTTSKSREIMYKEILNMVVNEKPELINNEDLFQEIKTLERDKKDKIQARQGTHDDCVMSFLIGMYMILYGNNTNKFLKNVSKSTFNAEDEITESVTKRVATNMNRTLTIISGNSSSYGNIENLQKYYSTLTIDNTDHGRIRDNSKINSSKKNKISRSMSFLSEMNKSVRR